MRDLFTGRRGRLLAGLLLAEFAGAIQSIAYSTVLPIASAELDGSGLYGATLASGQLTMILVLAAGPATFGRLPPPRSLAVATALYVGGVALAAAAPSMTWVLAGSVLRGAAAGLLAGFGLTAVGALYEDELRARVFGMFAVVWLLPSLFGPVVNAVVAEAFGWRWAMAWPAVAVLGARLLVGRDAAIIPWQRSRERLDLRLGPLVVAGLVAASAAPVLPGPWRVPVFVVGLGWAHVVSSRVLWYLVGSRNGPTALTFTGLCLAFFGGSGLIALAVVEALGRGAVATSVAFGAGLLAWSVTGLRPSGAAAAIPIGLALLAAALAAVAVALAASSLPVIVVAWAVAGLGMGLAYPRLSAASFSGLPPERVPAGAAGVSFAETAGTAVGALLGGGVYSLASVAGVAPATSIAWACWLLAAAAVVTTLGWVTRPEGRKW